MNLLVRAIVMGFGMAAGAAIFKRVSRDLGLDDKKKAVTDEAADETPLPEPPMDQGGRAAVR